MQNSPHTKLNSESHTQNMKMLTEEQFLNKMLLKLKLIMLTQPKPMNKESTNSQI